MIKENSDLDVSWTSVKINKKNVTTVQDGQKMMIEKQLRLGIISMVL